MKKYALPPEERRPQACQQQELRRLKAELKRVTEERDILKRPPRSLPTSLGKVRVHCGSRSPACRSHDVPRNARSSQRLLRLEGPTGIREDQGESATPGTHQAIVA